MKDIIELHKMQFFLSDILPPYLTHFFANFLYIIFFISLTSHPLYVWQRRVLLPHTYVCYERQNRVCLLYIISSQTDVLNLNKR